MAQEFRNTDEFRDALFWHADISGSVFRACDVNDVKIVEGHSGTSSLVFTISLSAAAAFTASVTFATADGTASAGSDYLTASGTATIPAGATSTLVAITINGDTALEGTETFFLNLSGAVGANITDGQGLGRIRNDDFTDPVLSGATISAAHLVELRTAINGVRAEHGLPDVNFTDATVSPFVTAIRAVHITELRGALDSVYTGAGQSAPSYTDATLAGVFVKAQHLHELRQFAVGAP